MADDHDVSGVEGEQRLATAELFTLLENELHGLAHRYMSSERRGHTLQTTALVNEAYVNLSRQRQSRWQNREQFLAVAARAMRRILVDHARNHTARKRGGTLQRVVLEPDDLEHEEGHGAGIRADILDLEEALEELAELDERYVHVVELRFFGGLTIEEVAGVLGVAPRTVDGDWLLARSWLRNRLAKGGTP